MKKSALSCLYLILLSFAFTNVLPAESVPSSHPTIVFMTDFGIGDDSVALCKGVMISIEPDLRIVDLTHEVTPYSIQDGSRFLAGAAPYFPAGTVFVAVVDPGVGSRRKPIVAKSKRGQFFVLPDNGLLTLIEDTDGIEEVREITNTQWMIGSRLSSTFHGRDIFSPVAAHLAHGEDWTQVGPVVKDLVHLNLQPPQIDESGIKGEIIALDGPFGNLVTNIKASDFQNFHYDYGDLVPVRIGNQNLKIPFEKTFSDVPLHQPLLYIDSRGRLAFAVNQDSFAKRFNIKPPAPLFIARKK
jgi:S-adenosylmethionine hydrolase